MYDWLGYIGGFFYVLCYLPQIMELYCKKTNNLNNLFVYFQILGGIFMLSYGFTNSIFPVIILNIITLVCLLIIIYGIKIYSVRLASVPSE